ncbi:DUF4405 domain-containing protein [Magnetococcus sp. PR-3]|uniref:DUF4405 domain-containing protein n=1 Tax=Magnetococcus sp. PR-3 TaxID=3120355 RepID=UPI002FCE622E
MSFWNSRRWSTPVLIGAGLFVTITGVLMFFHLAGVTRMAHEWIGLGMAVATIFHVLTHWSGFKRYFTQPVARGVMVFSLVVAGGLVAQSALRSGAPAHVALFHHVEKAALSSLTPLLGESAMSKLEKSGVQVSGDTQTLEQVADQNNLSPDQVISLLFQQDAL